MSASRRAIVFLAPLVIGGCSWFTDFRQQPKVDPWETADDSIASRGNPQMSVPTTGSAVSGFQVSYANMPGTIDSIGTIAQNPTPPTPASLDNGWKYYSINCAVCHGDRGMGDGPATKYGFAGINIVTEMTKNRTDGYIFGMIRNGRGMMPPYNRIEEMDRWDVVNYVRGLQGRVTTTALKVGPPGRPGITGDSLPGASRMGPTRPAVYLHPTPITPMQGNAIVAPASEPSDSTRRPPADTTRPAPQDSTPRPGGAL